LLLYLLVRGGRLIRAEDEDLGPWEEEGRRRYRVRGAGWVYGELWVEGRDVYQELKLKGILALGRTR
jgi:hypothetical protein